MRYCLFLAALLAPAADLPQDLVFRASFDKSLDAEKSPGDPQLYSAPDYKTAGKAGLGGLSRDRATTGRERQSRASDRA